MTFYQYYYLYVHIMSLYITISCSTACVWIMITSPILFHDKLDCCLQFLILPYCLYFKVTSVGQDFFPSTGYSGQSITTSFAVCSYPHKHSGVEARCILCICLLSCLCPGLRQKQLCRLLRCRLIVITSLTLSSFYNLYFSVSCACLVREKPLALGSPCCFIPIQVHLLFNLHCSIRV